MCSDNACSVCSCVRMCSRVRICSEFVFGEFPLFNKTLDPKPLDSGVLGSRYCTTTLRRSDELVSGFGGGGLQVKIGWLCSSFC